MARNTNIKLRRSATAGAIPTTSNLDLGELAINTYDGKLFLKKNISGTESIVEIGGDSGTQQTAVYKEYVYTATNNQTSFSGSDDNSQTLSYVVGYLQVFLNGVLLENGTDYTATTGNSVVLVNGAATSDILQISTFVKVLGTGDMVTNTFTGNGSTAAYTLTTNPDTEENTIVFVDGVYQEKDTYTVSGTTLTFDANVPNGASIEVVIGSRNVTLSDVNDLDISGDLTVDGNTTLGNAATDTVTFTADVASHLIPSADSTFNIGASGTEWANVYADTFTGNLTGNVTGNLTGNVTGTVSSLSNHDTDDLTEGSSNLYFTNARVDSHLSGGTGVTYSSGTISIGQAVATTDNVTFNNVTVDGTLTSDDITSTNISVAGNATITGNLTVQGTTTSIDSNTVNIGDNIIVLNSDETGTPSQNAGIEIERGTSTNTLVRWNETSDIWEFTNDGSTYYPIATDTDDLSEGSTNLYYTDARVSTRVDTILNHSNHTNITVSKVGNELRLSAASSYGDSDVESYLDGGTSTPVLSNTDVNGTLNVSGTVSLDGTANELRFYEGSNYVGFEAPALSGDQIWVLPDSDGTAGYALKTDGSGNLSWGLAGGNAFETIAIAGQSSVVADSSSDTLTLAAGTGITLTTNASTDTITITNSSLGANAFGTIAVSGQSDVDADSTSDTLTLVGQNGVAITTDASTDTVTIDGRTSYSPFTTDLFTTANATTTDFVLSVTPSSEDNLIVFVEGVYQNKNSYSLSSNTLTLSGAPGSGEEVVVHIVSDLISGQSLVRNNFTGDNSTTDFTLTLAPMNENNTFVYLDGVYQEKSEYSVSGTTLSFTGAPASGDSIEVIIPKTTELQQPAVGSIDDATMYDTTVLIPQTVTATTVASTSATTIATHAAATYRTIKYLVQCTQGTDYHSTEINLIHDGTTVYITEYGTLFDNASLGTFNATISSGNILLQITPGSATSMAVKVMSSAIPV